MSDLRMTRHFQHCRLARRLSMQSSTGRCNTIIPEEAIAAAAVAAQLAAALATCHATTEESANTAPNTAEASTDATLTHSYIEGWNAGIEKMKDSSCSQGQYDPKKRLVWRTVSSDHGIKSASKELRDKYKVSVRPVELGKTTGSGSLLIHVCVLATLLIKRLLEASLNSPASTSRYTTDASFEG